MSRDPIIIVGAGIGGLRAALALLGRGIDVRDQARLNPPLRIPPLDPWAIMKTMR